MNNHRAICNRILWTKRRHPLSGSDVVLQKTPFTFDVSICEIFVPLICGARLFIARPGGHRDTNYLNRAIRENKITIIHFVPSMLRLFIQEGGFEGHNSLRRAICTGEAVSHDLQKSFFARSHAELHNMYGPTEAAVEVTLFNCDRDSDSHIVPIGRPIANVCLYVLDHELEPAPINCLGELHIGGIALATGYAGNAMASAEKFIPDPFSECPGARMYRTGDMARYLPDGNLDFIGRIDSQVKLRGARVELGEIEATLSSHSAIKDCAVLVKDFGENDQRLLSYVVFSNGVRTTTEELRRYLSQWLPEYMIPSAFIPIDALPITPNGKVDRVNLLRAAADWKPSAVAGAEARTPLETRLCEIWAEVLQLSNVGVDDNFFALGGHSSLAMQLIGKIRREFQLDVPLDVIFSAEPTVASLAQILEELGADNPG